ncbi:DUF3347 domain-containing protein [Pedobacter panaciterrae]|jgi:Protein of unknown function (DUF3347).|uniref:DUF3347 domain-containing protein n=1 Tax=Pedobacter panaciterrae TaxID=363849 RepID=UPI00155D8DC8|nr:DUF3347 domain-containing protein [Pedobacter panaciterrae]NQX53643.1 DUF3347 domain-containing protein [Pedobacter panaciterrae]
MKKIIFSMAASILWLAACTSGKKTTSAAKASDSALTSVVVAKPIGKAPTEALINAYLQLKNALTKDNDNEAAEAGKSLVLAITIIDKNALNAEQSKAFSDIADDAKEHAEHISASEGNINHQREHFETLSQDIYELVKIESTPGRKLYFDHCPMYNQGKGGNWISETKDIHNPYLGKAMPDCGRMIEEFN